ncbi:GGDEF domain-containing protein, partial [Actinoplanes sp. NPDC005259]
AGDDLEALLPATAQRLRAAIAEPICGATGVHRVGASIGYAIGRAGEDFSRLVAAADAAMYIEKRRANAPVP